MISSSRSNADVLGVQPEGDEVEVTLFGPGYGECVVLHLGAGNWAVVDSCIDPAGEARALTYFERLGVDPSAVKLVVATHWHDDHIRGLADVLEACGQATFCCSAAFAEREFLAAVGATQNRHLTVTGSGVQELHRVLSSLKRSGASPRFAMANRLIWAQGAARMVALSPDDSAFATFLAAIAEHLPGLGERKGRAVALTPNGVAVVLWVRVSNCVVLLGSDLERRGWAVVLRDRDDRTAPASVFKVPHHGSAGAHEGRVWDQMLDREPVALVAPWSRAGRVLPTAVDVDRIAAATPNAYVTTGRPRGGPIRRRTAPVERSLREAGVRVNRVPISDAAVRLRRKIGRTDPWRVELLGDARGIERFAHV